MTTHAAQSQTVADPAAVPEPVARAAYWLARFVDRISARIANVIATRPLATRATLAAFMVIGIMFGFASHARAQGMMQSEIDTAYNFSTNFGVFDNSIKLAEYIFATLAVLTIIVKVLSHYIRNQSVRGLGQVILSSVLSLGLPFVVIEVAPKVVPMICMVGLQITDVITGNDASDVGAGEGTPDPNTVQTALTNIYNATFGLNATVTALTPKSIVDMGVTMGWPLIDRANKAISQGPQNPAAFASNSQLMNYVVPLAITVIGAWVFIAVELVIAYLQIYLVLPVAAFSLGFLGSPATRQFGSGYWIIVVQALIRFSSIVFVIGFAMSLATIWSKELGNLPFNIQKTGNVIDLGVFKAAVSVAAVSGSLLYIVRVLPSMFGAILTGMYAGADGNSFESQAGSLNAARQNAGREGVAQNMGGKMPMPGYLNPQTRRW